MYKLLAAFALSLVFASVSFGQNSEIVDFEQHDVDALVNRTMCMIEIITMEAEMSQQESEFSEGENDSASAMGPASLEIVSFQQEKINKLHEEFNKYANSIGNNPGKEEIAKMVEQFQAIEETICSEILLPHQARTINGRVFARLLSERGGDYLKTIEHFYPDKIQLTDAQKKKLKEVGKEALEQRLEAAKTYRAELQRIAEESNEQLQEVFSSEEVNAFGEPSAGQRIR